MDNYKKDFIWKPTLIETKCNYIDKEKYEIDDLFKNIYKENCVLITGQVQSGKTKRIIEIIRHAALNEEFNSIIVIGGYNNKLFLQTQERLKSELNNIKPKNDICHQFKVVEWKNNISYLEPNCIYNILKNAENLKSFLKAFKHMQHMNWNDSKILIIDDECDFFSIKNYKVTKSEDDKNDKILNDSIYDSLKKIYHEMNKYPGSLYINVTATPYANIINNYDKDFGINAIYSLPINSEYNGLKYFNKNVSKHFVTNNFFFENNENKYIDIVTYWLMQTILYFRTIDINQRKSELIIFDETKKQIHSEIYNIILKSIKENENIFKQRYQFIKAQFNHFNDVSFEEFENIFQKLKNEINESLIVLNSNKNNDDECYVESDLKIYIGGFLLSRGLTFENLLVEYFGYTPDSITYDTLLQRCRWFGYRSKLINHMKIICKEKTIAYLKECEECIEYFFNNNTLNGAKFKLAELRNKISSIKKTTSNYKKG